MDIQIIQVTEKTSYFDFAGISIPFYRMGDGIVLLDSGYHYMGERIRDYLKENGLTLLGIIHSHIHIDHVSGDDAFPLDGSIPIYGCRDAIQESYEEHSKPSDQMATRVFDPADFLKLLDRFRSCLSDTGDDGRVEIGGQIFRVLEMPGHSKYHRAIITPDDVCYVGDALMYGKTLEKAKAPYTFNLVDDIRSKKEIARLDCPAFIAAHEGHFGRDRLSEVVRGKAGGLDEPVEQGGRNFSGGQRQRLTIARALVGNPKILILDDSFSALDFATDAALRRAPHLLPAETTVFIVSQRTSSLKNADQIIVMDDGRMAGIGKHDDLLKTCEVYREIYETQMA